MAASRRITPLKLTPPPPVLKPWGVQVAFGTSKRAAQSKAASNMSSCRATVKGRKLDMLYKKNRVSGRKGFFFAQYGADTRTSAQQLCAGLRQKRCTCLVVKN